MSCKRAVLSEDDYRQTMRVTYERPGDPDAVAECFTGQVNRALGGTVRVPVSSTVGRRASRRLRST
jgi:hypothetical protein